MNDKPDVVELKNAINVLIEAMKNTECYHTYRVQCSKLSENPELKRRVNEYRERNFQITNSQMSGEEIFRAVCDLQKEYGDILDDLLVSDFLAAELDFCRMVQDVNLKVTEALDFE